MRVSFSHYELEADEVYILANSLLDQNPHRSTLNSFQVLGRCFCLFLRVQPYLEVPQLSTRSHRPDLPTKPPHELLVHRRTKIKRQIEPFRKLVLKKKSGGGDVRRARSTSVEPDPPNPRPIAGSVERDNRERRAWTRRSMNDESGGVEGGEEAGQHESWRFW